MKRRLFMLFFVMTFLFLTYPIGQVSAATSCIKVSGGVPELCVGYIRCPVGINIYCCDNQPDCQTLQGPIQAECESAGGMCHLSSDICQTELGQMGCPEFQFCGTNCSPSTLASTKVDLCSITPDGSKAREDCQKCVGIWTAIGCIPTTPAGIVGKFLPFAMGLGGGIAFLLMLFGGLQIMTSAGNPEKLNAGKELVTSAVVGLLLIVFSIYLLKLIGADILGVSGFK